uniref:Uncharacterized protein n=1 Tax=Arundo donax TaxID=35708 RepID=A0A0A8ZCL0_ARUDO
MWHGTGLCTISSISWYLTVFKQQKVHFMMQCDKLAVRQAPIKLEESVANQCVC